MTSTRAPRGLKASGKALWVKVAGDYELSPGELAVLEQACRTQDELDVLATAVAGQTAMVTGSQGQPKANPLFAEIRQHRKLLDTLVNSLALPMPEEMEGRPRSTTARRAARQRWTRSERRNLRAVGGEG